MGPRVTVGVRALKNELSAVLRRVAEGETFVVTDRNHPVALVVPLRVASGVSPLPDLVRSGHLAWSSGKPAGSRRPPRVRGPSIADAVIEDRR